MCFIHYCTTVLNLTHNQLYGPIPAEIGSLTNLGEFDSRTKSARHASPCALLPVVNLCVFISETTVQIMTARVLTTLFYTTLFTHHYTEFLSLGENGLTGPILHGENGLTGPIPSQIGQLTKLGMCVRW